MENSVYPKWVYHPSKEAQVVKSAADEKKLGKGWVESPAEFGVESAPGSAPDETIAAKKAKSASE